MLLLHAPPLGAEVVHHAVVDGDEPIDLRLADLEEARGVVAVVQELRAVIRRTTRRGTTG